ncbi:DDE-type integrase/transposase/recombinase [Micromonospora sp. LZ34]
MDQYGQVIDMLVSARRDAGAVRQYFRRALLTLKATPAEVVTDAADTRVSAIEELKGITRSGSPGRCTRGVHSDHGEGEDSGGQSTPNPDRHDDANLPRDTQSN